MHYRVIAECVDARSGTRMFEGDIFEPRPDDDQAARLIAAGAIVQEKDDASVADKPKRAPKKAAAAR